MPGHPHGEKVFPDVHTKPPVSQFVPTASSPVTGHHWKGPGPVLFASSPRVLI